MRTPLAEDDVLRGDRGCSGARGSRRSASRFLWSFLQPGARAPRRRARRRELPEVHVTALRRPAAADPRVHAAEHGRGQRLRRPALAGYIELDRDDAARARLPQSRALRPVERRPDLGPRRSSQTRRARAQLRARRRARAPASTSRAGLGRSERAHARRRRHELRHLADPRRPRSTSSRTSTSAATGSACRS